MTAATIFNPSTVERNSTRHLQRKAKNTLRIVSQSGFQKQNGESGTSLRQRSQTTRENNDLSKDLQSTHCPYRLILLRQRFEESLNLA